MTSDVPQHTSSLWNEFFLIQSTHVRKQTQLNLAKQECKQFMQRIEEMKQKKRAIQDKITEKVRELKILKGGNPAESDDTPEEAQDCAQLKNQLERLKRYHESVCRIMEDKEKMMRNVQEKVSSSWEQVKEKMLETRSRMDSGGSSISAMDVDQDDGGVSPNVQEKHQKNMAYLEQEGVADVQSLDEASINKYCNEMMQLLESMKTCISKKICESCMYGDR
uniref:Uncharacterized protein n=1 Tax=Percolomonas cosmopolitus TaxID=63605 RepID=A0A7S1KU75_9EUKA|mmetsp:Transcript_9125/g.33677  ORF Transcript_9125/g.33677 Transcript_9125/m.33677 type:complete len:221 (+) Transcript_9125:904-1566(+)